MSKLVGHETFNDGWNWVFYIAKAEIWSTIMWDVDRYMPEGQSGSGAR